jgi:hypothetical protein
MPMDKSVKFNRVKRRLNYYTFPIGIIPPSVKTRMFFSKNTEGKVM